MSMTREQMNTITDFVDLLCKQIDKINKKGDITPDELQRMDKAIDIIKDCSVICAMETYGKDPEEEMYSSMGYYGRNSRTQIRWAGILRLWDIQETMEPSRQCGTIWR